MSTQVSAGERELDQVRWRNEREALRLPLAAGTLVGLVLALAVGVAVSWWLAPLAALVVGALVAFPLWNGALDRVIGQLGASPITAGGQARLENLVQSLEVVVGVARPELYLIDDPAPNALSVGTRPDSTALVVSTGVLELPRIELEGILARELGRLRTLETAPASVVASLSGPFALLRPLAPLVRRGDPALAAMRADQAAVAATRYPPGLAAALERIDEGTPPSGGQGAVGELWMVSGDPALPSPGLRAAALREL